MTIPALLPNIPSPPAEYSKAYMESVIQALMLHLRTMNAIGNITVAGAVMTALPTSAAGLPVGTLWNDAGTVKVTLP